MKAIRSFSIGTPLRRIGSRLAAAALAVVLGATAAWGQYADEVLVDDGAPVCGSGHVGSGYGGGGMGCADCGVLGGAVSYGGGPYDGELWGQVHSGNRWYATFSLVGFRVEGMNTPALVTTSAPGTPQGTAGVLPDATVLLGEERLGGDWRHGGEIRLGWWLVDGQFLSVEGHYMTTQAEETHFEAAGAFTGGGTGPILARPFFDVVADEESAVIIAFDDFFDGLNTFDLDGSIDVDTRSQLQSAGAILRHVLWADFERNFRIDLIGGYRFLQLDESLLIRESVTRPPVFPVGTITTERRDLFDSNNEFHGGEIGLDGEWFSGRWSLQLMGKVAMGNNHQTVTIEGETQTTSGGATAVTPGGFLATASNSGEFFDDRFAVMPEAHLRVNYDLSEGMRVFAGYRYLFINEVARPGDQIDVAVGGGQPIHVFSSSSAKLHGFDTGFEVRW